MSDTSSDSEFSELELRLIKTLLEGYKGDILSMMRHCNSQETKDEITEDVKAVDKMLSKIESRIGKSCPECGAQKPYVCKMSCYTQTFQIE